VSESPAPDRTDHAVFIALMVMMARLLSVLQPETVPFDHEELYNAAHAQLIHLEHADLWLDLQYRGYCGGCTQHALLGAGLFGLFGSSLFVWKLIPVLYSGLMAYAGARFLRTAASLPAAIAFGLLLTLPPPAFHELSLTAWGNHTESGVAAVVVLALAARTLSSPRASSALALGLATAWALWIGFSSVFIVVGLLPLLLWRLHKAHIGAFFVGLSAVGGLWLFQYQTAPSGPFETIYYAGESLPRLTRIPEKLWSLMAPKQLVALFGISTDSVGQVLGLLSAGAFCASLIGMRKNPTLKPVFAVLAAFLLVYSTVRFTVWMPPGPHYAPPGSLRYAAPLYGLLFLVLAAAVGELWMRRRFVAAFLLLSPALTVGLRTQADHYRPPFPDKTIFDMAAADFEYARDQAGYILSLETHQECPTTDPIAERFHAFGVGWHEARRTLNANPTAQMQPPSTSHLAGLEGLGAALLAEVDSDEQQGPRTLNIMLSRLERLPDEHKVSVLASAAQRRSWLKVLTEPHDDTRFIGFSKLISSEPSSLIRRARTQRFGHLWGSELARYRQPRPLNIPDLTPLTHPASFIRGLSQAIGERWGPGDWPVDLEDHQGEWEVGLSEGVSRQWLNRTR
jgi:hypothetical protein